MFNQNRSFRSKNAAKVRVTLAGGDAFDGFVFLTVGDRLIDLLNDDRAFIPIRRDDGETMIVAKQQIASIIEAAIDAADLGDAVDAEALDEPPAPDVDDDENDQDKAADDAGESGPGADAEDREASRRSARRFDPYETLRISPDATIAEIRAAYKTRIKAVHPDSIASLGLDDDLKAAALKSTQRVNYAYRKIMQERETAAAKSEARDADAPETGQNAEPDDDNAQAAAGEAA